MDNIFNTILQLSIMGGMLALIVIVIWILIRNHLQKKVLYVMWIMVFIKFAVPIDISLPINIWGDINMEGTTTNIVRSEFLIPHRSNSIEQPIESTQLVTSIEKNEDNVTKEIYEENPTEKSINLFPIVWFVGMFIFAGILIILYFLINRRFRNAQPIELDFTENIFDERNSRIKIYKDKNAFSPMVLGIACPKIILPEDFDMSEEKMLTHIILHEAQHIKWKDSLINVISLIILSIHWFNPLLWISYILFSRDIEGFCDERVLRQIGEEKRSEYANSLLSCAISKSKYAPVYTCSFGENNVKERIKGVMKYKKNGVITGIIAIVLIAVVLLIFTTNGTNKMWQGEIIDDRGSDQSIEKEKTELEKLVEESDRVNVLLMGLEAVRTDTMILASFDPTSKDIDLISIPRDTYYHIKGYDSAPQKKINAAYGRKKVDGGGPEGVMTAVSNVLNVPVDHYLTLSYEGVESIVNSLEGVKVNIPFDMDYDDPWAEPPLHIHFKEGARVLNGKDAVKFLRYRQNNDGDYSNGDVGRIERQQQFVKAAVKKTLSFKLPAVANTVFEYVKTSMNLGDIENYSTRAIGISIEDIETYQLPGEPGMPYYIHDIQETEELMLQIYKRGLED